MASPDAVILHDKYVFAFLEKFGRMPTPEEIVIMTIGGQTSLLSLATRISRT